MALYVEISVSLQALYGLTRRRAEIPDVIFLQMFQYLASKIDAGQLLFLGFWI